MSKKRVVAIDLDGTLAHYDGWRGATVVGDPIAGAREFMGALKKFGFHILVYSTRTSVSVNGALDADLAYNAIVSWLEKHQIPHDDVFRDSGKPLAEFYIDDRAVICNPLIDSNAYTKALGVVCAKSVTE